MRLKGTPGRWFQTSAWHSVSTEPGRRQHTDLVVQQPTGEAPEEAHVVPAGAAGAFPYSLCRLRDWRNWRNWRHGHRGIECRCQRAKLISLRFVGRKKISYQARVFWRSVIAEQARRGARAECGGSLCPLYTRHVLCRQKPIAPCSRTANPGELADFPRFVRLACFWLGARCRTRVLRITLHQTHMEKEPGALCALLDTNRINQLLCFAV